MLNKSYSPSSLIDNTTIDDVIKYRLGRNRNEILASLTKISYGIVDDGFDFLNINKKSINGKDVFTISDPKEYYALKQIDFVLRKVYKIGFSSKFYISKQVSSILQDGHDYQIIRVDVKSFFEEVDRERIIHKISDDSFLSSQMMDRLKLFNNLLLSHSVKGLSRGVSLSSTMSELCLRNLDRAISELESVYYYNRYVDDIVIICNKESDFIYESIVKELSDVNLSLNDKSVIVDLKNDFGSSFDYLGSKYEVSKGGVSISLSDKKIKKIKTRIIKSIIDSTKNRDYSLLGMRLDFLSNNSYLYKGGGITKLKHGIYYSNPNVNNFSCFNELNSFLRKSLSSKKGSFGRKVQSLPRNIRSDLMKKCFFNGFVSRSMCSFSSDEMRKIRECWKGG